MLFQIFIGFNQFFAVFTLIKFKIIFCKGDVAKSFKLMEIRRFARLDDVIIVIFFLQTVIIVGDLEDSKSYRP